MNTVPVFAWQQPPFRPMIQTNHWQIQTQPLGWLHAGVGATDTPLPLKAAEALEVPNDTISPWRGFGVYVFGQVITQCWQLIWDQGRAAINISRQLIGDLIALISELMGN